MSKRIALFCILLLVLSVGALFAQDGDSVAILEYFDNDIEIEVLDSTGTPIDDIYYGLELMIGDTVKTNGAMAEIRIEGNGSILKLAKNTVFTIVNLQNTGNPVTEFTVITGKLRTIAARTSSGQQQYLVNTPTAVCGVRGTDFTVDVAAGLKNALIVKSGLVEYINTVTGQSLSLGAGMLADTFSATFEAIQLSAEQLAEALSDMDFTALDPAAVPGQAAEQPAAEEQAEEETEEVVTEAPPVLPEVPEAPAGETVAEEKKPSFLDPIIEKLKDILGMEIGSVTIDGETWAKALIQPTFTIGKLKMSLYLPIIYKDDMFDPESWYHPNENDEWSFGTDKTEEGWQAITADVISDLFLKIRYIEWGEQRDKFFFKVGNLNDITVGHGLLMDNYANDADFPAIRRVGVNTGFDFNKFGFELMANDLASGLGYPDIFGGRFYFRPAPDVFRFAIGVTGIVDLYPASMLPTQEAIDATGDPAFINASIDFDFPIIENDVLSIIFFGDVGGMIPFFRGTVTGAGGTDVSGFYTAALFTGDADTPVRNYGIATGLFGNILIMDYRLEYRNFNGTFKPSFFNNRYDRLRGEYAQELAAYVADSDNEIYDNVVQGIYGEAGFSLMKEQLSFDVGYMAPFYLGTVTDEQLLRDVWDNDTLHIEFVMEEGTIPSFDIHGSISLDRTGFVAAFIEHQDNPEGDSLLAILFDERTVIKGEVIYPVVETLDIAAIVTTTSGYDEDGVFGVSPSISIETRLHF